ncbi:alpha/beta hydrolase [Haliovirga abyssi]|uniref:Alpha/beta hydrolase n=1 Tax=Haliovirga abyssi TaxID=2996794 RepID=A0AAU9E0D3_9FUSO|nr:alpha/beta hydrolase [Haliovirga abyssi]BDU49770.1 alpha/beta hydrolase [Haliovirga abyssi]
MEKFEIKGIDGNKINVYKWVPKGEVKGVVQIFHGMAEHALRYKKFAIFLNDKGYAVYANDHRGHGNSVDNISELGRIGENGFYGIVEDEKILMEKIKKENLGLPIIILGHSMGSFIAQEYITKYGNEISGVILSGTAMKSGMDLKLALILAKLQMKLFGRYKPAKFISNLSFGSNNKKIQNAKTSNDWLSRDEKEVDKYNKDKYCGTTFPIEFYYEFFKGLSKLYEKEKLNQIPLELPIYIFSGDADPVGNYGKSTKDLYNLYEKLGLKNLEIKLYSGGRHEMLNEKNRMKVYENVYNWIREV